MDVEAVKELLRPVFTGRKVVLAGGPVQGKVRTVAALRSLGAERPLLIGSQGTGEAPSSEDADVVVLDVHVADMMDEFRQWEALFDDPSPAMLDALSAYDPEGEALVLLSGIESATTVAERPVFGARLAEWTALEDKTVVDAFFDRAGVARAPVEVVPVDAVELLAAHRRLDRGGGTVWVGDARDGWHGGGSFVHRVRGVADATAAVEHLGVHCDRARVMPFLGGIPCSIHGFVTGDGVAALRPVELVVLRTDAPPGFRYAGTATNWDPPSADREAMRTVARSVGEALRAEVAYRGGFTVDGVLTSEGFLPTELNPRLGAGLSYLAAALPALPLLLLQVAVVAGVVDIGASGLEALAVDAGDRVRSAAGWTAVLGPARKTTRRRPLVVAEGGFREAADGEAPDATVTLGPSSMGTFLRVELAPERLPAGASVAPTVASVLTWIDRRHHLGIGPLEAAPAAR